MSRRGLLASCLLLALPVACRQSPTSSPHSGETPASDCPRLLSAAPNVTEICCALGLADCLVGRTRFCNYPPAIRDVPSIGALNDLHAEVLLELQPDLILVAGTSRAITNRLTQLGLQYESLPDVSLCDLFAAIERVGELTHRSEPARRLTMDLRSELNTIAARYADTPPRRVLLLLGPLSDPPTQVRAAGPGSFYDDLLKLAGHVNIAAPAGRPFTQLSLEFILQADPDVIIELSPNGADRLSGDVDARRAWGRVGPLQAVANQRVYVLVGEQHFVLGPRMAQTMTAICETIAGTAHD